MKDFTDSLLIHTNDTPNIVFRLEKDYRRASNPPYDLTGVVGVKFRAKVEIDDPTNIFEIDGVIVDAEEGTVSFQLEETDTATPYNKLIGEIEVDISAAPVRRLTAEQFYFKILSDLG